MRKGCILLSVVLACGLIVSPALDSSGAASADAAKGEYRDLRKSGSDDREKRPLSEELDDVFRGLMEQMRPALDDFLETLEMLEGIDSIEHYERPEIMPNGDIIIRRREDAPPFEYERDDDSEPGVRT